MYDVIVALDWAKSNMAIARLDKDKEKPRVFQRAADIAFLKRYLSKIKESKSLTIEESSAAHYLFTELVDYVDEIIVADPFRNKLLLDGPKNDLRDAANLALLTRSKGLIKPVYHSLNENYEIRKLVSGYEDLIKASVRAKNQYEAFAAYKKELKPTDVFIMKQKKEEIGFLDKFRRSYEDEFAKLYKKHAVIRKLSKIDGIGIKSAVKIVGIVLDANRFCSHRKFLAYCGLVKYRKQSGGRDYGERITRYSRPLKAVFKMAAVSAITNDTPFRAYYKHLVENGVFEHNARNSVARLLAKVALAIMKSKCRFDPKIIQQKIVA